MSVINGEDELESEHRIADLTLCPANVAYRNRAA
jgi:hypothetical protein